MTQDSAKRFGTYANYRCSHANYVKVVAADIDGDAPGLCQLVLQSKTNAASVVRVAKRSIGTVDTATNFIEEASGTQVADTTASEGNYVNHAAPNSTWADGAASIDLTTHNYGLWRALARVYAATAATTADFRLRAKLKTTDAVIYDPQVTVNPDAHTKYTIIDLGEVPIIPPRGNSPTNMQVYLQYARSSGSDAIREDCIWLLPLDEFYHVAEPANNNTSYKLILSGLDNRVFVASAASSARIYEECEPMGMALTLEPNRDNYFFFLCDAASDANNTMDELDVLIKYTPRYVSMRGTG